MKAEVIGALTTVCLLLFAGPMQGAVTISYDASVPPDDSSLQTTFSTFVGGGTSWASSGGELTMTTAHKAPIWFGNHDTVDPVSWNLADNALGNALSVRARLCSGSPSTRSDGTSFPARDARSSSSPTQTHVIALRSGGPSGAVPSPSAK